MVSLSSDSLLGDDDGYTGSEESEEAAQTAPCTGALTAPMPRVPAMATALASKTV